LVDERVMNVLTCTGLTNKLGLTLGTVC
jgi:hypothetical protein